MERRPSAVTFSSVPRILANGQLLYPEQVSMSPELLAHFHEMTEKFLKLEPETMAKAVITVLAYFNDDGQRQATVDAGKFAGLDSLERLEEAAKKVLAYDLCEGTFVVAVINMKPKEIEVLEVDGDTHSGGEDLFQHKDSSDKAKISDAMRRLRRVQTYCEKVQKQLATAKVTIDDIANGLYLEIGFIEKIETPLGFDWNVIRRGIKNFKVARPFHCEDRKKMRHTCLPFDDCVESNKCVNFVPMPTQDVELKEFPGKGKGVVATKDIPAGTFLFPYLGKVMSKAEKDKKYKNRILKGDAAYIFQYEGLDWYIDARGFDGLGHLVNHQCPVGDNPDTRATEPTAKVELWLMGHVPVHCAFSAREIQDKEEITYNYFPNETSYQDKVGTINHCLCSNCELKRICSEPGCFAAFDHPSRLLQHSKCHEKLKKCQVCGKEFRDVEAHWARMHDPYRRKHRPCLMYPSRRTYRRKNFPAQTKSEKEDDDK